MEDFPIVIFVEDARAGGLVVRELLGGVVVLHLSLTDFLLRERHTIIAVEVVSERGNPFKTPAQPLLEGGDLRKWRA